MILLNPRQVSHPNRKHCSVDMGSNLKGMRADDILISAREFKEFLTTHSLEDVGKYMNCVMNVLTPIKKETTDE